MPVSLTHVKGDVKADTIFDLTFDARQNCSKSNFSSSASTCPLFDYKGSNFDPNGWDPFVRIENGFRQRAVIINRYAGECGVKVCRLAVDSFIH